MKKIFFTLIIFFALFSCQTKFESKDQAKNEVNKLGYRIGRWVDYLNSNGQLTKDLNDAKYYVLSEYKDGKSIGKFKLFNIDNSINRIWTYIGDTALYDKYKLPIPSEKAPIIYYENGIIKKKEIPNEKGRLQKQILYSKNAEINRIDSFFIEYYRFPSQDLMQVTFKNDGKDEVSIYYDEFPWIEMKDTGSFHKSLRGSDYLRSVIKGNLEGKFSKEVIEEFESLTAPGELLDRIHYIDFGRGKGDLQSKFKDAIIKTNPAQTISKKAATINVAPVTHNEQKNVSQNFVGVYEIRYSSSADVHRYYSDGTFTKTRYSYVATVDDWDSGRSISGTWKLINNGIEITFESGEVLKYFAVTRSNKVVGIVAEGNESKPELILNKTSNNPELEINPRQIGRSQLRSNSPTNFYSETDVMAFLDRKEFVNDYDTNINFGEMGSQFTMKGVLFYNPDITVVSRSKAIIKYYQVDDPSSSAVFIVNGSDNTLITRGSGTVWRIQN